LTFPPWLALCLVVNLALALAYQVVTRRFGWRVLLYWTAITAGFLAIELGQESMGWNITRYGDLRLAPDLVGAGLVVGVLWFFRA
jgi:hypothetical protein